MTAMNGGKVLGCEEFQTYLDGADVALAALEERVVLLAQFLKYGEKTSYDG